MRRNMRHILPHDADLARGRCLHRRASATQPPTNHQRTGPVRPPGPSYEVIKMFGTFLLGVLLMTSLVLVVLLVAPQPQHDVRANRLPVVGALIFLLFALLAVLGGWAIAA